MSPKTKISKQYFQKRPIPVTILQVKHPAHFILKECIKETSSLEAKNFLEAEKAMQKYYGSLESDIYQLPLKDTVLVALVTKKFYRARVIKILLKTDGHHFRVYLLDYGRECEVTKDKLYSIQKDFLAHPYQAIEFKLIGLEPISLVINPLDLTFSSGPVETWDTSAVGYIESLTKENQNFTVQVKGVEDGCIVGSLFYQDDCGTKCVNDEFVERKYAQYREENLKNVQSIDALIENEIQLGEKIENKTVRKKTMVDPTETALFESVGESRSNEQPSDNNRLVQPLYVKCDSPVATNNVQMQSSLMVTPPGIVPEKQKEQPKGNPTLQKLLKLRLSKSPTVLPSNKQLLENYTVDAATTSPPKLSGTLPVDQQCKSPNKNTVNTDQVASPKTMSSPSANHVPTPASKDFGMIPRKLWKSPLKNGNHEMTSNLENSFDSPPVVSLNPSVSPRLLENNQNVSPASSSGTLHLLKQRLSARASSSDQSKVVSTNGTQNPLNPLGSEKNVQTISPVCSSGSLNLLKQRLSSKRSSSDQSKVFSTDETLSSLNPLVSPKNDQNLSPVSSSGSLGVLKQRLSSKGSDSDESKVLSTDATQKSLHPSMSSRIKENVSSVSSSASLNLLEQNLAPRVSDSDHAQVVSADKTQNSPNPLIAARLSENDKNMSPSSSSGSLNLLKQRLSPKIPGYDQSKVFSTDRTQKVHVQQPPVFSRTPNADQISFGNAAFASIHSPSPRIFPLSPRLQFKDENSNNVISTENLNSNNSTSTSISNSSLHNSSTSPRGSNVVQSQSVILENTCTSQNNSSAQKQSLSPHMTNVDQNNQSNDYNNITSEVVPSMPPSISSPNTKTAALQNQTITPINILSAENYSCPVQNQSSPKASNNVNKIMENTKSPFVEELKPSSNKNLPDKFLKYKNLLTARKSSCQVLVQETERNEKLSEPLLTFSEDLLNSNQTNDISKLEPSTFESKEASLSVDKNENTSNPVCDVTSPEKCTMSFSRYKNILMKKKLASQGLRKDEHKVNSASSPEKNESTKNISDCDSKFLVNTAPKSDISEPEYNKGSQVEKIHPQSNSQNLNDKKEEALSESNTLSEDCSEEARCDIDNVSCSSDHLNQSSLKDSINLSDHNAMLSDISDTDDLLLATLNENKVDRLNSVKSDGCDTQDEDFTPNPTHMTNTDFSSLWEKQEVPALQIGDAPPAPIKTTDEANFPPSLCKILKKIKFIGPTCIQSVVWPAMLRHRNVIAIAPPHAGKSVGYILPIASQFHSLHYEDLPSGNGPIAIILCSSWKAVQDVYELCCLFMQNAHVKIITLYADGRRIKKKMTSILNGCDVLIATPYEFLQAVQDKVVDFSRCCHLIMDDGDKLVLHNKKELRDILLTFVEEVKEKRLETVPSLALCAERWNKTFAYINKTLMTCPVLCFTSFLEAAIYAEVPFFTHVCTPSDKKSTLLGILENANVVISVTKAEDALDVYNFLSCESIRTHLVTERMEHHTSTEKIKDWKSVHSTISPNCLIITDAALTLMPVSNAKCLIHYDVPKESRLQFGNRFSCIAENFLYKDEELHHSCHVLISEYCPLLASSLIDVIKRSCGYIPDILKKIANENQEPLNTSSPLCHYMKAFGCCKQKLCQQRHVIEPTVDAPSMVPKEGDIQALVTHVIDASHYFVRLLKYLLPNMENAVCLSAQYAKTGFLLKDFYGSENNRKVVKDIIIGETYAIEEDKLFYRIKVLDIQTSKFEQRKIKMLFIDEGWVKSCADVILYALPDNLELPSPVVVEVYLCNVLTLDSCPDWNPQANHYISNLILGKEIYGKIMLCIGEVLWLHPIALRTKLCYLNEYLNVQKINKALVENGFAKENRNHLNLLLTACEGKVPLPNVINEFRKTEDTSMEQPQINYAFLECNVEEEVYVSSVISPHQLFVQRKKFTDCLDDLIMKINDAIGDNKYAKCKNFHLGMYCIAPFHEDNKFYRALITDVTSDSENVELFYIDFGDSGVASKKDIYVIGPELLLLPLQAIECELRDVSATHGGWSEKSIDYLTDLTRDAEGDMKILTLKAYKKESSYSGGNHYIVDIWDGGKTLSECLVQAGLAEQVETVLPVEPPTQTITQPLEEEPPGYAESSDDRDTEDKDCEALFCCVLSKLLLEGDKYSNPKDAIADAMQEREAQAKSQAVITEVKEEENESTSPAPNVNSVSESDKKCSVPFKSKHPYILKILNRCPKLQPRRPLISWWDTPNQLYITINVKDITTYNLELNDLGFKFHTSLKNVVYSTEEQFYSSVHSQDAVKQLTAQALNLTLHKQEAEKWPRFTKELGKFLHIKYNWEHLDDSESDDNVCPNSTAENNRPNKDCDIAPFASDESHESSTDHEEKYVEPWRKMATYKDPYDPLD